ncbi:phosphopentomutase [Cydia splendana]|uniref:phosphopentomutase n=1 Tax=Cydia splendana TaxID=1100963 RepID=UPI0028F46B1C
MQVCNSGDLKLDTAVEGWLKIDKNPETRKEVLDDIANSRWDKLRGSMLKRQKFGTAGLRGPMAAGYTGMNDVVVLQTAQGLCSYIQKECHQSQLHNGIVIGYDGRYNSKRFAELTARVFVSASIPVHLFSAVCPTPLVSFATILYGVAGGVMITASHNPKEDNGYKVYWGNGSQITAPHDQHILDEILQYLDIPDSHWVTDGVRSHELVSDCLSEVTSRYMQYIADSVGPEQRATNARAAVDAVYSAMHGVGYDYVVKAFESANLKPPISVPEQQEPNPDFPTVAFPNPEEPECLEHSKRLAEQRRARLVLVNDPDADRLAVAEFDQSSKKWKVFSGNEMGALLSWWLLKHATGDDADRYVITSIVSSKMLRAIVKGRGHFVETLTGFKWMGNTALLLMQQGKNPLFAFEEAIGYMCSPRVPDKDGVSAAVHVASLASHLYSSGSSLGEQLQALYREYGYHVCLNGYFICHDQAAIHDIFARIRNYHGPAKYPQKVGSCEIVSVNDFAAGVKVPEESTDNRHLHVLGTGLDQDYTSGEMVILQCSNGLGVIVRTSGTEPKLKYYTELVCKADTLQEQEQMNAKLKVMVKEFMEELLQPHQHGLIGEIA